MPFTSLPFAAFFAVVFVVYWIVPWQRARIWWLVAASFFFYATWSKKLALLVAATSVMDYLLALAMERFHAPRSRKLFLGLSLGVNLGLLCYFKYVNFFLDSLFAGLAAAGWTVTAPVLKVLVPFGISFYTFEAISYTIDVYRGRLKAERNLANFMLFILFFPHLVAGPIVRAWDFLPQAARAKRWNWPRASFGAQLFILGLFKKLAISDRLAVYSDPIFDNPDQFNSLTLWLGLVAFGVRIWADFSGYSDMALGAAHLLGYKLTKNFNLPYLAANIADFWRRWHISLSSWLRDYLFIPLGGSRGTTLATCRNLLITMTIGGLWHGANWSYVLWGVLHGSFLVAHRLFRQWCATRPRVEAFMRLPPAKMFSLGLTCFCVLIAWAFFQPSLRTATTMLSRMFVPTDGGFYTHIPSAQGLYVTLIVVALGHLVSNHGGWRRVWNQVPAPMTGVACGLMFVIALVLAPATGKPFIYFQF
jgi:alginate O-acetyltransferase complex protein AlgI